MADNDDNDDDEESTPVLFREFKKETIDTFMYIITLSHPPAIEAELEKIQSRQEIANMELISDYLGMDDMFDLINAFLKKRVDAECRAKPSPITAEQKQYAAKHYPKLLTAILRSENAE
jgi:hypothetical protein